MIEPHPARTVRTQAHLYPPAAEPLPKTDPLAPTSPEPRQRKRPGLARPQLPIEFGALMHAQDARDGFAELLARSAAEHPMLVAPMRDFWMRGDFGQAALKSFYREAQSVHPTPNAICTFLTRLENQLERPPVLANANATFSGRLFDSKFAALLVDQPPAGVLTTSEYIGSVLYSSLHDAERCHEASASEFLTPLQTLATLIQDDARPWFPRCPTVADFLAQPDLQSARDLFCTVEHGHDVIKMQYLAVRAGWTLQAYDAPPEWLTKSDQYFREVVSPERSTRPYAQTHTTSRPGILLEHQPSIGLSQADFVVAKSWADDKGIDFDNLTKFERSSIERGHPIVSGASGSSNILSLLHNQLSKGDPNFSIDDAFLASVMFLVYDGGHSIHEVAAVHAMVSNAAKNIHLNSVPEDLSQQRKELQSFKLDYRSLLPSNATSLPYVTAALNDALRHTVAHVAAQQTLNSRLPALLHEHSSNQLN